MTQLLHEILLSSAHRSPSARVLAHKSSTLDYAALAAQVDGFAAALTTLGLERHDRVAVFLPKQFETVVTIFGAVRAGCVFVPVNPLLKAAQVEHILRDCALRVLVTFPDRSAALGPALEHCPNLRHVVLVSASHSRDPTDLASH